MSNRFLIALCKDQTFTFNKQNACCVHRHYIVRNDRIKPSFEQQITLKYIFKHSTNCCVLLIDCSAFAVSDWQHTLLGCTSLVLQDS